MIIKWKTADIRGNEEMHAGRYLGSVADAHSVLLIVARSDGRVVSIPIECVSWEDEDAATPGPVVRD